LATGQRVRNVVLFGGWWRGGGGRGEGGRGGGGGEGGGGGQGRGREREKVNRFCGVGDINNRLVLCYIPSMWNVSHCRLEYKTHTS